MWPVCQVQTVWFKWNTHELVKKNDFLVELSVSYVFIHSLSQVVVTLTEKLFEVKLPDGKVIEFPNRKKVDVITYIRIKGDIKLTSFKLSWEKQHFRLITAKSTINVIIN